MGMHYLHRYGLAYVEDLQLSPAVDATADPKMV